jgi:uncharacterized protein (TIGR02231 family)
MRAFLSIGVVLWACLPAGAQEKRVTSKVESVTLFRGQALVTRVVNLPEGAGEMEAVVPDLPADVVGGSLFAVGDGVKVRSVRYRTQAVAAAPKKEVADLDAKIRAAQDQTFANAQMLALLESKTRYLDKLEGFTVPTLQMEMAKGVLDAKQFSDLTEFVFKQRAAATLEKIQLTQNAQKLSEEMSLLQRQRAELAADMSKTERQAAIFLSKPAAGAAPLRLSYLVSGASWSPAYEFRLAADGQSVSLDCAAQVRQTCGEDWTDVKLTLSTATPAMNAEIPLLAPMTIRLAPGGAGREIAPQPTSAAAAQSLSDLSYTQYGVMSAYNSATEDKAQANWELNRLSAEAQTLEMAASGETLRAARVGRTIEEGLAVSYEIPGKMTLASRDDVQLVQILAAKVVGKSFYQAIPLLTNSVYRGLEMVNTTEQPLLAGPYTAYAGSEFVGLGMLPMVAKGQTVSIGFGVDTQLRCWRELTDKTQETKLGSKIETFNYSLFLESYKDKPVTVRLIDRIPITKAADMETRVAKTSLELSGDPEYAQGQDKPKGILRWDVPVPGGAFGSKRVKTDYSYEMKYASDRGLNAMPAHMMEDMKKEYDERFKAAH